MEKLIKGKEIAEKMALELKEEIEKKGIKAGLAVILVGDDPASAVYVGNKEKKAIQLGIKSKIVKLPTDTTQEQLLKEIDKLNKDKEIDAMLLQLPIPKHLNEKEALLAISPDKDADGIHPVNAGRLFLGIDTPFIACTPAGIIELIKSTGTEIKGKEAVVIGRSNIVGKPVAMLLMNEHATVTICHSRTKNIGEVIKRADIIVAAIGKAKFVTKEMVKPGALVIDVGTTKIEGKLYGDVDFENVKDIASAITPVPGGVGPMTIAMLMKNCVAAAKRRMKIS